MRLCSNHPRGVLLLTLSLTAPWSCTVIHKPVNSAMLTSNDGRRFCAKARDGMGIGRADEVRIEQLRVSIAETQTYMEIATSSGRPDIRAGLVDGLASMLSEWDIRTANVVSCDDSPAPLPTFKQAREIAAARTRIEQADRDARLRAWNSAARSAPPPPDQAPKVLVSVPINYRDCFRNLDANLAGTDLRVSFDSVCRTRSPVTFLVSFSLHNTRGGIGSYSSTVSYGVTLRTPSLLTDIATGQQATTGIEVCHETTCRLLPAATLSFDLSRLVPREVLRSVTVIEVEMEKI